MKVAKNIEGAEESIRDFVAEIEQLIMQFLELITEEEGETPENIRHFGKLINSEELKLGFLELPKLSKSSKLSKPYKTKIGFLN